MTNKKISITQYTNEDGSKTEYVINYHGKYGILTDLSESEEERLESTFNIVVGMWVKAVGDDEWNRMVSEVAE